MKSGKRLDSAVFQLTPTRTRYDLVINAKGKTEKIASGLLNPFLAHLKTAQDQIAKGGYSITLEPIPGSDSAWFTKGTLERFIRFVSNPEVLERVKTIESEIMQIEEAIAIQGHDNIGLNNQVGDHKSKVEDHQEKSMETIEGSRPVLDTESEQAIVLYQPGVQAPESNKSTTHEENSRVQLLRVLETRRTVLQKEQGMAFARAVAAGFEIDHMAYLISFAECFGASRLMEACLRFMDLWKAKHENGQWLEIEAQEAMSTRSDFSPVNAFGTNLTSEAAALGTENNGKANNDTSTASRPPIEAQLPPAQQEFFQGQFQHPMYPQWPIHSQPGAPPVFQAYPMQGMPYYPNYPGGGPFFQPHYPPMEDPRFNTPQRIGKRHSMDSKGSSTEPESWENGVTNSRSQDGSEVEKEGSQGQESRKKVGRSGKNKSGMVVIRNINYITSKRQDSSGSETQSISDPETDEEAEGKMKHKNSLRTSKSEEIQTKSTENWNSYDNGGTGYGQETDGGNWKAFQSCLLRDDDKTTHHINQDMFSVEKEAQMKRRKNGGGPDPLVPYERDLRGLQDGRITEFDTLDGKITSKLRASDDELMISQGEFAGQSRNGRVDVQYAETGARGRYRRETSDDFMIRRQENQSSFMRSQSDPLDGDGFDRAADNFERNSSYNVTDESFIVPIRSGSHDQFATHSRTAIDMDNELPSGLQNSEDFSNRARSQLSYEPEDLSLMPERRTERESIGYDLALEYEMQVHAKNTTQSKNKEDDVTSVKVENKDKKSKGTQGSLEKRRIEAAMKRGKPSKLNPPNEAQARADRLRAYKADLLKMKKEKDEEDRKRIEALKMERQKRIAARGSSTTPQSSLPSQTKPRQPVKLSPSSHKGSKFSDSEPGSSSPLQRLPIRHASVDSSESQKITKPSRLNTGGRLVGNGLSRSVSSLPELKKQTAGLTPEPKGATRQIRRQSDPKMSNSHQFSSAKLQKAVPSPKPRVSDGPEIKKISAIMSLDKTKAATLPELKIKTSKGPPTMVPNKPMANGSKSTITLETAKVKNTNGNNSHDSNVDENPVIEKTVVMLEPEMPSIPVGRETLERIEARKGSFGSDKVEDKTEISEYAAIHAAASPLIMEETVRGPSDCHFDELHHNHQVPADYGGKELSKFSTMSIAEKPYQAPYARNSSLEDPCTTNLDFSDAPPRSSETLAATTETAKVNVSDFTVTDISSVEQILESSEKPRGKESSKGFRRFLKLGRKNHSSSADQHDMESDKLSMDGSMADDHVGGPAVSDEVHTLKNLISQSETPTDGTSQKASRTFSLLSPFRKTSEKKLTT